MTTDKFTKPMYVRLWWPAMASSIGWALSDMADAVVVGQSLGTTGLAAISLILPIYMFNCMMAHGLGLGGSVKFTHLLSSGQEKEAHKHASTVMLVALFLSVLTAILGLVFLTPLLALLGTTPLDGQLFHATKDYLSVLIASTPLFYFSNILNYFLRNDNKQKRAGIGSVVGNVSDIVCNILLVLVFHLGTRGAALSTSIGQIIAIAIYLPGLYGKESHLRPMLQFSKEDLRHAFQSLRSGFATSVQYLYQMIFFLICNNVLMKLSSENGVAIFDLIQNTSYLILYLYEGTARAMQPILSTYYGECNMIGRKNAAKLGFASGIAVGTTLICIVAFFPQAFCALFGIQEAIVVAQASTALRIYCIGAFFAGISILICNYYQSCEQLKGVFLIETMRGAAILLPCTFLFSFTGIRTFWWLFPVTEVLSLFLSLFWMKYKGEHVHEIEPERIFHETIDGTVTDLAEVCDRIEQFCEKWNGTMKQKYYVVMMVEELGFMILQKGIQDRTDGYIQITVIAMENGKFKLHIRDNAKKFNPFDLKTQKVSEGDEFMDSIGMLVLKEKAEEFFYHQYQGFNSFVLTI